MKNATVFAAVAALLCLPYVGAHAETRQWTNTEGKTITGELKGVNGEMVSLLVGGRLFELPLASLSEADRAFVAEAGAAKSATSPASPEKAYDGPIMKELKGNLKILKQGKLASFEPASPEKIEIIAFYSSASWCGPCHRFTPELSKTYESLKRKHDNFELVLLSADRSAEDWEEYVKEYKMPFPVLDHGEQRSKAKLDQGSKSNGIPSIHIVDREGNVLDDATAGAGASLAHLEKILKERSKK